MISYITRETFSRANNKNLFKSDPLRFPMLLPRRGQGLSTNAIILIILGVIILVVLIAGFAIGWKQINPFLDSSNNVDIVVQQCQIACSTANAFDYCRVDRTLEDDSSKVFDKKIEKTCDVFSNDLIYEVYRIQKCPQIQPC